MADRTSAKEYLKENNKLADFERAVALNDLQSIYSIFEDFVDSEVKNCSLHDVVESSSKQECYKIKGKFCDCSGLCRESY